MLAVYMYLLYIYCIYIYNIYIYIYACVSVYVVNYTIKG